MISIHAPRAGCDCLRKQDTFQPSYFNPRTPCGVRQLEINLVAASEKFQSTHPVRGATSMNLAVIQRLAFQSTHPVRGATKLEGDYADGVLISIHAPRAGCDDGYYFRPRVDVISIHAPRAGCDS